MFRGQDHRSGCDDGTYALQAEAAIVTADKAETGERQREQGRELMEHGGQSERHPHQHRQHEISNMDLGALALPGGLLDGAVAGPGLELKLDRGSDGGEKEDDDKADRIATEEDLVRKQIESTTSVTADFPDGGWRAWRSARGQDRADGRG